jgi:tetratricopeptide (TPR) repeat protein
MGRAFSIPVPEPVRLSGSSQIRQLADYAVSEPGFIEAFLALPESPADEELFTVVMSILRTALGVHPDYADLHYFASVALWRLNDVEGAILHARRAVQINPAYARALVHLAELEAAGGDVAAAVEHLRRAVQAGADWADVHLRLGDWLRESGDRADSARHYRRALELNRNLERASAALVALAA